VERKYGFQIPIPGIHVEFLTKVQPPKINIKLEDHLFEKENHLEPNTFILRFNMLKH